MQATTRAFLKRGGAACAAAAVLIGGTFAAGAASAAPESGPTSSATSSPTTAATPSAPAESTAGALPAGLKEALKRDLGETVDQFEADGKLATKAAEVQTEVKKVDPAATVSIKADTIEVKASATATATAKAAAGDSKVSITTTAAPSTAKTGRVDAAGVKDLFNHYVAEFGAKNLQSVMVNAAGQYVIHTGDQLKTETATSSSKSFAARTAAPAAEKSVDDFIAGYNDVIKVVKADGPASAYASDVVNGQGYATNISGNSYATCSIGWNGFNKTGQAAVISAGHCTRDGSLKNPELTDPTLDSAGKPGNNTIRLTGPLGTFGFSQFGGPGNSPATGLATATGPNDVGNIGTDVSVIDSIASGLKQRPLVTNWSNPANLTAGAITVTGVSKAVVGANICKSGRTSGWTCGTVDEVGVFLVGGIPDPSNPADVRAVRGFGSTTMKSTFGDSGGSVISGSLAVGITSAGGTDGAGTDWAFSTDLQDALAKTGGYSIKIFVNAPTLATPANNGTVFRGDTITGKVAGAPAGTEVVITLNGKKTTVKVDANGKWTFKAPTAFGPFTFTAQAKNGFSSSTSAAFKLKVIKRTLAVPVVVAPAPNGTVAAPVKSITGTGKPGATVEFKDIAAATTGSAAARAGATPLATVSTAVVDANGKWKLPLNPALAVGSYTVTLKQTLTDWNDSKSVTSKFKVVPAAPTVTSSANGQKFANADAPTAVSGSNVAGATVSVTINGQKYTAKVVGTTWTVSFRAKFVPGTHTVSVTQTIDGFTSAATTTSFTVLAAPAPAAGNSAAPAAPAPQGSIDGSLAETGASGVGTFGAAGGVLLLTGAALLLFRRRKTTQPVSTAWRKQ